MSAGGYFGQFLLQQGLVTRDQLLAAVRLVDSRSVRFGDLAVGLGMISLKLRDDLLSQQGRTGERFGDLAVKTGAMRPEDVNTVLSAQRERNQAIGDALVELGYLSREALGAARVAFDSRLRPSSAPLELGHLEHPEHRDFVRWSIRMLDEIAKITGTVGTCEIEDDAMHVAMAAHTFGWCEFHLLANRATVSRLARTWTGGWQETQQLLDDALREFLNTVVGRTLSASPVGRRIVLEPPVSSPRRVPPDLKLQSIQTDTGCMLAGFARGRTLPSPALPSARIDTVAIRERRRNAVVITADAAERRRYCDMLSELGFTDVRETSALDEALDLVAAAQVKLVILDVSLPGQPLTFLADALQASPLTHILVVGDQDHRALVSSALESGASGQLPVGPTMPQLQGLLAQLYLV